MTEEGRIQKSVFDNLRKRGMPGMLFWHVPNDKSSRRKAGYREGVHDVHILYRGDFYSLELKTDKGKPSEAQMEFMSNVNAAGGYSFIAHGEENALSVLECWGVIRRAV